MLLFWIMCAVLTVAVVLVLTRPLTTTRAGAGGDGGGASETEPALDIYRNQLKEIEADAARGLIDKADAEAARVEVARRMLAIAERREAGHKAGDATTAKPAERAFLAIAAGVPVIALAIYMSLGSPGLPSQPAAERQARLASADSDVRELVARVEARLRDAPGDGMGWDVIAPVYLRLERYREAVDAYARALAILGETPVRLGGYAEALVLQSNGIVTEPARRAYERLLVLQPGRPEARFGLALAKEQDGDLKAAFADYSAIIETAPPEAPWRGYVGERLQIVAERLGQPVPPHLLADKQPAPPGAEAIARLEPAEQQAAIRQMVEGLAVRLKGNGSDLDGWLRLIRAWSILGEAGKAEAALADARKALTGNAAAGAALDQLAKGLGLKS